MSDEAKELEKQAALFLGPSVADLRRPIIIRDDFHETPDDIRKLALAKTYVEYSPPATSSVGDSIAREHAGSPAAWFSTVFRIFKGQVIAHPFEGFRYDSPALRRRLAGVVDARISEHGWAGGGGDGWNGAFHYMNKSWRSEHAAVHHHWKEADVNPKGYSGLVFLTPNAPAGSGTALYREKVTGKAAGFV